MLQFIKPDFKTGKAVCIDGSKPYVHWSDPVSVGLKTYMTLYWISDKSKHTCTIEEGGPLYFPLLSKETWECDAELDWNTIQGKTFVYPSVGQQIGDEYWHHLNIILDSTVEGEFIADLHIDNECISVGAQFFGEDEALNINLANQGLEMTNIVEKSLYESDPHTEPIDYVRLNAKLKELFVNFMDIHGNKGSYKSLINSLEWFGYHDLVELREIWRYHTPDGTKYYDRSLSKELTDVVKQRIFNSAKTTSLYLRHLVHHFDEPLHFPGELDETQPTFPTYYNYAEEQFTGRVFDKMVTKWSLEDMKLKMVLLGAFFERYFMSIHNELVRSVCEDIWFNEDTEIKTGSINDYINQCDGGAKLAQTEWTSDQMDTPDYDTPGDINGGRGLTDNISLFLDEVHVAAGIKKDQYSDLFINKEPADLASANFYQHIPIVGCQPINTEGEVDVVTLSGNYFHGLGAVAKCHLSLDAGLKSATIITDVHKEVFEQNLRISNSFKEDGSRNEVDFYLLFQRPGSYNLVMEFEDFEGGKYTKIVHVKVSCNIKVDLEFKILKSITSNEGIQPNPWEKDVQPSNLYMLSRTNNPDRWAHYTQFIPIQDRYTSIYDAPYKTIVYNYRWKFGQDYAIKDLADIQSIVEKFDNTDDHYCNVKYWEPIDEGDKLVDGEEAVVVQMIEKRRTSSPTTPNLSDLEGCDDHWTSEIFFPQMHTLGDPSRNLSPMYPVVCIPVIKVTTDVVKTLPFSYYVDGQLDGKAVWSFRSDATGQIINELSDSIMEPFMAWKYRQNIPGGSYVVSFRYNLMFPGDHSLEVNQKSLKDNTTEITKRTNFKIVY